MATLHNENDRGRFRKKRHGQGAWRSDLEKDKQPKTNTGDVAINSAVIQAFKSFQVELDSRNDCYERIVKLSRDITIESKRIIFHLHRVIGSDDRNTILTEAAARLLELRTAKFLLLAKELNGQDPYQFLRAYTPGLQEYIEAVTFYHYLSSNQLVSLSSIQAELTFIQENSIGSCSSEIKTSPGVTKQKLTDITAENNEGKNLKGDCELDVQAQQSSENCVSSYDVPAGVPELGECASVCVPIPPTEYMLGVADFTGELMKMAINSVGYGDLNTPKVVSEIMRVIHDAFATFGNIRRDLRQKTKVLRQSLQKVETACYAMKVRGSEMPTHMLVDVFTAPSSGTNDMFNMDESEEFYE